MPLLSLIYTTSLCSLPSSKAEEHAKLRHIAADLLFVTGEVSGVPSLTIKSASFYHKTGVKWHELRKFDLTSSCFERATDLLSKIGIDTISDAGEKKLFLDLSIARSKTDWEVSNRNLVVALLNRATSLLFRSPEHYKTLVNQYSVFGKSREGTAGAETAKGVFLGQRCHVSASAAVRVSHRVLRESCSEGSKVRAKVVSELVSDDRVVTLFSGEAAAKQRTAMHDVLWNCAADHFRLKDYVTSADLFEKAMLYIPFDIENRILRAMGFYAFGG